jgi:L-lactate dehydrogenase complex protein LldG
MSLDTTRARTAILERIRRRQARPDSAREGELAARERYLNEHPDGPRPASAADPITHFRQQAERMASTVAEVAGRSDVPAAVADYLDAHGLPRQAVAWPELADLDWRAAGLELAVRPPREGDLVGLTGVYCAVAETGSLVCFSGPRTPASTTLLPETHIAVVPASRVLMGMEDVWALARRERGELPRAVNFISGPSRTGDIEQTIVLGAHGPYRVHIVLVRSA